MTLVAVRNAVGFGLVAIHLLAILLCYVWLDSRLNSQDFRITILILVPVSAVYALAFLKRVVAERESVAVPVSITPRVTISFAALSFIFTGAFGVLIIYTLWQYQASGEMSPNDLKDRLALIEVMVGAFLGLIADSLFGSAEVRDARANTAKADLPVAPSAGHVLEEQTPEKR
jgi:hypothetical protein